MSFLFTVLGVSFLSSSAFAGAETSSFNTMSTQSQGKNFWSGRSAVDQNTETAWMTSANEEDEIPWIQIDGPNSPSKLNQVRLVNGYAKTDQTFKEYTKIKKLKVEAFAFNDSMELYSTKQFVEIELKNTKEPQVIQLPKTLEIKSTSGGKYRFWITDVYKTGEENYPENIALSELSIFLEDSDVTPKIEEEENVMEGEDVFALLDGSKRSSVKFTTETIIGFDGGDTSLTRVAVFAGTDRRYARPKKVQVSVGGRKSVQELPEKMSKKPIWIWLPSVTGYPGGSSWDTTYVQILETYPGSKYPEVQISEIQFRGLISTTLDGIDP